MEIIQFIEDITWSAFEKRINEIKEAATEGKIEIQIKGIQKFDPSFLGWLYLFSEEKQCKVLINFHITDNNADKYYECLHLFRLLKIWKTGFVDICATPDFQIKEDTSKDFFPVIPFSKEEGSYNFFFKNSFSEFIKDIEDDMRADDFWKKFGGDKKENVIISYIKKRLSSLVCFSFDEFNSPVAIQKLCKAINNDNYNFFLNTTENTLDRLNELLIVPNFYDILYTIKPTISFSQKITELIKKTKEDRNKKFFDLSIDKQVNIERLNRFLLEETYPKETPKIQLKYKQWLKQKQPMYVIFFEHYLQLLSALNCLKGYVEELTINCSDEFKFKDLAKSSGINAPGFSEEVVKKYWAKLIDFINKKVCTKPPFFVIMFALIVANYKVKLSLDITEADGDLSKIYLLTSEYYYRLLELVDNITEHTETGNGVIISRVRKKVQAKEIRKDKLGYFDDGRFKDIENFLEIAIMDIGEKGIIKTSIGNWEKTKINEFEEDARELEKASIDKRIKRFFKPEGNYFNHQALRTSACMGLLMFSHLIDNNKGCFALETTDLSTGKAIYYTQYLGNSYTITQATDFRGSKYDIILPVDLKNVNPFVYHEEFYEIPEAISVMEFVAKHEIVYLDENIIKISKSQKDEIIIRQTRVNFNNDYMIAINKRMWENGQAERFINEYPEYKYKRMIICFDCDDLTGNNIASLFRIIAKVQEKCPSRAIVISNMSEEIIMLLFDYLKPYIDMSRFWSDTHFIFGLSNYAEPFFIGGKGIQEWLCLNKYLEKYYAASNTIINKIKAIATDKISERKDTFDTRRFDELVDKNPLFIFDKDKNSYVLMPLQWFLKRNGTTVFENRVHNILINPIPEFSHFYD